MSTHSVSSTPVLRAALTWSGVVAAALAVTGAVVGFLVSGGEGMASALAGVLVSTVFLGITAGSILLANRWFGDPLYVQIFFGIVLGGWILKLIVFVVAMIVLRGQPWVEPTIFFIALVVSVLAALVVDVVVLMKMRIPYASDVTLPTVDPDERA